MSSISNFGAETGPTAAGTRETFAAETGSFFGAGDGIELFTSEGFLRPPPPTRDAAVEGLFSVAAAPFAAAPETLALAPKAVGFFNPLAEGCADAELNVEAFDTLSLALANGLRAPGLPLDAILLFESDLF